VALRVATLETLFTANVDQIGKAEKTVQDTAKRVEAKPAVKKIDAEPKGALAGIDRVEEAAKRLVSKETALVVNAKIEQAEKSTKRIEGRLEYLRSLETTMDVKADIGRAEASLQKAQRNLDGLKGARATMVVDVDDNPARQKLRDVEGYAAETGEDAGEEFGGSIVAALATIPIAGAVIGIGVAAGKALIDGFNDGLNIEKSFDRLQALTGVDEVEAQRLGMAAGEAYANNFGDSVEANMDTTRLALQFGIIDEKATTRDAQKVVQSLSGIADVLQEDVGRTAQAVTTLMQSGLARSADEAFDIIAAGAREGVNRGEDLLDTLIEYPSVLEKLGLSGDEMLGLLNQGLDAGARNSDVAADALKEFQIRATDASESSAAGFERLGLNAEEMTAKIAAGGDGARKGLQQVLDKLRETEDPVQRNAAAVELFGTKAEDLGDALFAMDLSTAVEQLDGVAGSAERMFATLADNDASKMETARRNIEVATDGIKGALAGAFSEPLGDFADWVSQNRGPVLQFFSDLVNGAIDFAIAGTESFGEFVSGPLAEVVEGVGAVIDIFNGFEGRPPEIDALADSMRDFDSSTDDTVGTLESMRYQFNTFGDAQIALGYVNDASLRLADAVGQVGSETGSMEDQVRNAIAALSDEVAAADAAGESQTNLSDRYKAGTEALVEQMVQSGMNEGAARKLIDTILKTPSQKTTEFDSNANSEKSKVQGLADRIVTLPDGSVIVRADASPARNEVDNFIRDYAGRSFNMYVNAIGGSGGRGALTNAKGNIVEFMYDGGITGTTPMQPIAQMVPANTWRVVGDRGDVSEAFIPLDGSPRSMAILFEAMRRMGVFPMAAGGVTGGQAGPVSFSGAHITGRLAFDGDGFVRLIDARIAAADDQFDQTVSRGWVNR
jgi:phage-related minor tail protein